MFLYLLIFMTAFLTLLQTLMLQLAKNKEINLTSTSQRPEDSSNKVHRGQIGGLGALMVSVLFNLKCLQVGSLQNTDSEQYLFNNQVKR